MNHALFAANVPRSGSLTRELWRRLGFALTTLRRKFHARPARMLRVRETLALGEKRQLLIVQCGEKELLIGAAGNCLTTLAELTAVVKPGSETA